MRLPIGYDIFKEIFDNKLDFIDKSLLIKDILEDEAKVVLITRPRRFGKTLNLSMLHHFLATEAFQQSTKGLFDHLQIAKVDNDQYMHHQGKYPVIFITFKEIKDHSFSMAYKDLCYLISEVYAEHRYLLDSKQISDLDKEMFYKFLKGDIEQTEVKKSFKLLCKYLHDHYGVNPWLLIDEYDTPIQSSYIHGYYDEMIGFMRDMFGVALKTNPYLHKAVITGILRVSKESLFSGLNNIRVYSTLQSRYSEYFGFTEAEVADILNQTGLKQKTEEVKRWYNGYQFGDKIVYNPWSIANYVQEEHELQPYWVNTSGNDLIRSLIIKSDPALKEKFEHLLQNIPIETVIDEHVTFVDLGQNEVAVWSLLLATGYLKVTKIEKVFQGKLCTLEIPNLEVKSVYRQMIEQWLSRHQDVLWYNRFLEKLLNSQIEEFAEDLAYIMEQVASVHDVSKKPEVFYHGLMLGFTASLDPKKYEIKSNKESGHGFYDILIVPKDLTKTAIVIELKRAQSIKQLEKEAEIALKQIKDRNYDSEIQQRGNADITHIGISFCGKEFQVKSNK